MSKWRRRMLGEISSSTLGKMLDKEKNRGVYHPYLANYNVRWGEFDLTNIQEMKFEDHEHERYGLEYGDLIICEGGEPGRCAIWRDNASNMKIQKALHRLRMNKGFSYDFLYYRMLLASRTGELNKYFIGSTIKHLTGVQLKQVEFDFPSESIQYSIASVLRVLDEKIEINNRINTELEAMAKTLYDYWFVQFDFPDANGKPYNSSGGKLVYDPILKREIPIDWEVRTLSQIANITMGQSPAGESYNEDGNGFLFFQGSTDFRWLFPTPRQYTTSPARMAKKGDILLSVRAPVGDINIANADCCIGRGLAALNSKSDSEGFLFYVMKYFKQVFDRRNSEGTTFGSITKNDLHSLKVVYPQNNILKKYDDIVSEFNKMIFLRSLENRDLIKLRDWLLPMLMNGQVTVR
ncbi:MULTISPECIES: restriction endonuclease subunit S [Yersinia]|uniref:restriction endonuclease subunit S n=1 Tax=Yersinia TaxID=629 RepID=UPI0005E86D8E|nr:MULTISPECIES: restriction endonuclease subunit S [Yersinia]CNM01944.1 EcoKI restriction-modification system protein HsdS [Yersinia intermedia]AXY34271.1 restriction endonuclease subunit S [Yersinia pseudotuberculosis]AYX09944.1 restriction endonuclease subunit S [Yersinia pseudotuberculosis]EKN4088433.1 restriction endonuclease subunit S [Yersinia enterocolitica]MBO1567875.1 restriction endonuclease subunit S [Yersinia pseudotuberculosis]